MRVGVVGFHENARIDWAMFAVYQTACMIIPRFVHKSNEGITVARGQFLWLDIGMKTADRSAWLALKQITALK
jgi:hypothetical protein